MIKEELLKEAKPVLFNTDMVQATQEGRKCVTRRLVKPQPEKDMIHRLGYCTVGDKKDIGKFGFGTKEYGGHILNVKPPYRPGDILYVRETWNFMPCIECMKENETCKKGRITYEDRHSESEGCFIYRAGHPCPERFCWRPSIHMPKRAARIFLKVKDVRVEHLQDMRLEDFLMEGIVLRPEAFNNPENVFLQAQRQFQELCNSTIPKEDVSIYGWEANPWVWAVRFDDFQGMVEERKI